MTLWASASLNLPISEMVYLFQLGEDENGWAIRLYGQIEDTTYKGLWHNNIYKDFNEIVIQPNI